MPHRMQLLDQECRQFSLYAQDKPSEKDALTIRAGMTSPQSTRDDYSRIHHFLVAAAICASKVLPPGSNRVAGFTSLSLMKTVGVLVMPFFVN